MKVLSIIGYKPFEMNIFKPNDHKIIFVKEAIKKRLILFIEEEGLEWVLISGQMGVELWAAEVIYDLKEQYNINIGIIPPFSNQESRWPEHHQESYQQIIVQADFHHPLYQSEYKGPYQFKARDKWIIDKSDACLVLFDEEYPGTTKFFLQEAKKRNDYPIYTITPYDLEETVQELVDQDPAYWNND